VLWTELGEQRFLLASSAAAWRGGKVAPAALRQGDHAIVRRQHPSVPVIDRIWAQVGRATGTIIEREGPATLLVDQGPGTGRKIVMIASEAAGRIPARADSRHLAAALPGWPSARAAAGQPSCARSGERHGCLARARGRAS